VVLPGVYEEPASVTLRQLIERAGGIRNGNRLKAVIPGAIFPRRFCAARR
jgi:NADH-quinone oxidoreductase subunit F